MKTTEQFTKRALVTGAAGFVGSHLVDLLVSEGWRVFGLDNLSTGSKANANPKCEYGLLDIRDRVNVDIAVRDLKPDVIFHLAAIARTPWTIDDPVLCNEVNITGTLNMILAAINHKVKRFVFASSNVAYADNTPYYVSKIAGEEYVKVFGKCFNLSGISLRFSNVYGSLRASEKGPSPNALIALRMSARDNGYITLTGDGEQSRDFTHVEDIARGCLAAAESDYVGLVDLCTGRNVSMNYAASFFNVPIKYTGERQGDIKHIVQSPELAKKVLNWEALIPFEEGIKVYTKW